MEINFKLVLNEFTQSFPGCYRAKLFKVAEESAKDPLWKIKASKAIAHDGCRSHYAGGATDTLRICGCYFYIAHGSQPGASEKLVFRYALSLRHSVLAC